MSAFELIATALSFVGGLAVAVVLTSMVRAFLAREATQLDWVPFTWATCLLLIVFQTWWVHLGLRELTSWTFAGYGLLVLQMVTLFVASALVLPHESADYPADLRNYFERDGRWSIAAVAVQILLALLINVTLFSVSLFDPFHLFHATLFGTCMVALFASRRSVVLAATVLFAALTVSAMIATAFHPLIGRYSA